jgi:hypothetical protein
LTEAAPQDRSPGPSRQARNRPGSNTPCKLTISFFFQVYSFSVVDERKRTGDVKGSRGRDKFTESPNDLLPPPIPIWSDCLPSVKQDSSRIKPSAHIVKGYRFPDPHIFIGTSPERRSQYLINWLSSRAGWILAVFRGINPSGGEPPHPSMQLWRDWLQTVSRVSPSLQPSVPSKAKTRKELASKLFTAQLRETPVVDTVFWREQQIMVGNLESLAPHVTAEILWDLFENNWRLEFLALDRLVQPDMWKGTDAFERDRLIRNVFPGESYVVDGPPAKNTGLAAESVKERRPYVEAFRIVVSSWPIAPKALSTWPLREDTKTGDVLYVERACVLLYCQTFFDHFGRAPVTPHRIPVPK